MYEENKNKAIALALRLNKLLVGLKHSPELEESSKDIVSNALISNVAMINDLSKVLNDNIIIDKCDYCAQPFPEKKDKKYCSDACRSSASIQRNKKENITTENIKRSFKN